MDQRSIITPEANTTSANVRKSTLYYILLFRPLFLEQIDHKRRCAENQVAYCQKHPGENFYDYVKGLFHFRLKGFHEDCTFPSVWKYGTLWKVFNLN